MSYIMVGMFATCLVCAVQDQAQPDRQGPVPAAKSWLDEPAFADRIHLDFLIGGQFSGQTRAYDRGLNGVLDFKSDLGIGSGFATDLRMNLDGEPGFGFIDLSVAAFDGQKTFGSGVAYGGDSYSAGTTFRTSGSWFCAEFGYGADLTPGVSNLVKTFAGVSMAIHWFDLQQTAEHADLVSLLLGLRAGACLRPAPFLSFTAEVGGWAGGKEWWVAPLALISAGAGALDLSNSQWDYRHGAFVSGVFQTRLTVRPLPNVGIEAGYIWRAVRTTEWDSNQMNDVWLTFSGFTLGVEARW